MKEKWMRVLNTYAIIHFFMHINNLMKLRLDGSQWWGLQTGLTRTSFGVYSLPLPAHSPESSLTLIVFRLTFAQTITASGADAWG